MPDHLRSDSAPAVGVLYPGEMGSALGSLLVQAGIRVVTTTEGRGPRTARLCREAGLELVESLAEVKHRADIVFSLVPPAAACQVAEQFCAAPAASADRIYIDANSVSPETAQRIGRRVAGHGIEFIDATIAGLASRLKDHGTLYLSGRAAGRIAALTSKAIHSKVVGDAPGAASAMKMMVGSFSKGLSALFIELGLMARSAGALDAVLEEYAIRYPEVMAVVDRMIPTYPQHAARRGSELGEVGRTMASAGLTATVLRAAETLTVSVGTMNLAAAPGRDGASSWTVRDVVEELFARGLLRTDAPGPTEIENVQAEATLGQSA